MFAMAGKLANGALADRIGGRQAITVFLAPQTAMGPCVFGAWDPWQCDVIAALHGEGWLGEECDQRRTYGAQYLGRFGSEEKDWSS